MIPGVYGFGLIRLVNGEADSATLRHEMLHAARSPALITKTEWQALVEKYAPDSKTDGHAEERVAEAFEAWRGPEGLWKRLTTAINRVLSKLGVVNPSADTAFAQVRDGKIWSRGAMPETRQEADLRLAGETRSGRSEARATDDRSDDSRRPSNDRSTDPSAIENDSDGIRYSGRVRNSQEAAVARLTDSKPLRVTKDTTPPTAKAGRQAIRDIVADIEAEYDAKRPLINRTSGRQVVMDPKSLRRFGETAVDQTRRSLLRSIGGLLRSAEPMTREAKSGRGKSGRTITAEHALGNVVEIDGNVYVVKHTLEEDAEGTLHYVNTRIGKVDEGSSTGSASKRAGASNGAANDASRESAARKLFGIKSRGGTARANTGDAAENRGKSGRARSTDDVPQSKSARRHSGPADYRPVYLAAATKVALTPSQEKRFDALDARRRRAKQARDAAEAAGKQATLTEMRGKVRDASEAIGEMGADMAMANEFPDFKKTYGGQGNFDLDRVYEHNRKREFIVVEAKGGSTKLVKRRTPTG